MSHPSVAPIGATNHVMTSASYRHYRLRTARSARHSHRNESISHAGENTVDRRRAHTVIVTHLPSRDWRWLGLRRRCRHCGQRYPCPAQRRAIALLSVGHIDSTQDPLRVQDRSAEDPSSTIHRPARPTWRCVACHEDWPCARRREDLTAEFAGRRLALALYMSGYLADALDDHPDAVESVLYLRFLGWFHGRRH